jgi:hypothetical protein
MQAIQPELALLSGIFQAAVLSPSHKIRPADETACLLQFPGPVKIAEAGGEQVRLTFC